MYGIIFLTACIISVHAQATNEEKLDQIIDEIFRTNKASDTSDIKDAENSGSGTTDNIKQVLDQVFGTYKPRDTTAQKDTENIQSKTTEKDLQSTTEVSGSVLKSCRRDSGLSGECVPYDQCNNTHPSDIDYLDSALAPEDCESKLDICCLASDKISSPNAKPDQQPAKR